MTRKRKSWKSGLTHLAKSWLRTGGFFLGRKSMFHFAFYDATGRDSRSMFRYQRAYLDFFEDELVRYSYDWKEVVQEYLFSGETPLVNSLASGREFTSERIENTCISD